MNRMRFLMPFGFIIILALTALVVMLLWNWLMPSIFELPLISFWQSVGLLFLTRVLLGGHPFDGRHHMDGYHGHFRRSHWYRMSHEEREAFRSRMKAFREREESFFSDPKRR